MKLGFGLYTAGHTGGVRLWWRRCRFLVSWFFSPSLLFLPSPPLLVFSSSPSPPLSCCLSFAFCFSPLFSLPLLSFPLFPPLFSFTPLSGGLLWTVVWFGGWSPWSAAQPQQVSKNGDGGVVHDSSSKTGRPATEVSRHNRPSPERCLYEQVLQDCVLVLRMMPIFVFTGTPALCRPTIC